MPAKLDGETQPQVTFQLLRACPTPATTKRNERRGHDRPYLSQDADLNAADVVWRSTTAISKRSKTAAVAQDRGGESEPIPEFLTKRAAGLGWYMAFNDAVRRCQDTDKELFKKGGRTQELVFADLKNSPKQHRARSSRSRETYGAACEPGAALCARADHIQRLHHRPTPGAPPFAVRSPNCPKVEPGEKLDLNVTFHGYFCRCPVSSDKKGQEGRRHH